MKAKKVVWSVILVVVVVVVLAIGGLVLFLDSIVASGIRKFGSDATGVPVELGSVSISLLGGSVALNKLAIANPEGYHEKHAFGFDKFFVDVDLGTVTSDTIVIDLIEIDGIHVAFEPTLTGGGNLVDIKNNIDNYLGKEKVAPAKTPGEPAPDEEKKPGKKVVIRKLMITNGSVTVASRMLSTGMTLPLATIEMTDIGEKGDSRTPAEVLAEVYAKLMEAVGKAVSGSGLKGVKLDGLTSGVQDTVRGIQDSVKDTGGDVKDAVRGLRESIGF